MSTSNQVQSAENAVDNTKGSDLKPALKIEYDPVLPLITFANVGLREIYTRPRSIYSTRRP